MMNSDEEPERDLPVVHRRDWASVLPSLCTMIALGTLGFAFGKGQQFDSLALCFWAAVGAVCLVAGWVLQFHRDGRR